MFFINSNVYYIVCRTIKYLTKKQVWSVVVEKMAFPSLWASVQIQSMAIQSRCIYQESTVEKTIKRPTQFLISCNQWRVEIDETFFSKFESGLTKKLKFVEHKTFDIYILLTSWKPANTRALNLSKVSKFIFDLI